MQYRNFRDLEEMASLIDMPGIRVVSFDVFDTLLVRPVGSEADKFRLLDARYDQIADTLISFGRLRAMAEASLRRRIIRHEPVRGDVRTEDVSLNEIYTVLQEEFAVPAEIAGAMLREEYELELRLCSARESGRFLFERAIRAGRRVVVTSDMYLSAGQIAQLLEENGFRGFEKVFVSSEYSRRKRSGSLYRILSGELDVRPEEILHIGDDPEADLKMADDCGFHAALLPKTMTAFLDHGCAGQAERICGGLIDWEAALREPGIAAMRQLAANRYFDDPFRPFLSDSDYNADPYFVGYAALGMEVLGAAQWLADSCRRDHIRKLLFLSRDGYLPMKAYELFRQADPALPGCAYMYVSRIALLPMMILQPVDLYDLPVDISYQTPAKLLRLLAFSTTEESLGKLMKAHPEYEDDSGVSFSAESWQRFIADFIELAYDREAHMQSRAKIKAYIRQFAAPDTAIFDMGYSGRSAAAILEAAETDMTVYYFHADGNRQFRSEKKEHFRIRAFFDFSPCMESTMREYAYLEPAASCIGYSDTLEPLFDCGPAEGYSENAAAMQKGALEMVEDYLAYFAGYQAEAAFRPHNAAMPFEAFIRYARPADRQIYEGVLIDDELWGGRRDIDLRKLMEARLRKLPVYAKDKDEINAGLKK